MLFEVNIFRNVLILRVQVFELSGILYTGSNMMISHFPFQRTMESGHYFWPKQPTSQVITSVMIRVQQGHHAWDS
jgi:hypothetical protein